MTSEGGDLQPAPREVTAAVAAGLTAPVVVPGLHDKVSDFDPDQQNWIEYAKRLELYFMANDIDSLSKKRAHNLLLSKTLAIPGKPTDLSFDEIVEKVKKHFNPKLSSIIKRYKFNKRKQQLTETVSEYIAALWRIAEYYEYGDTLNDTLQDHLVCGVADKRVQVRYFRESKLTYAEALEMAQAAETAFQKLHSNDGVVSTSPVAVAYGEETTVHQISRDQTTK